MPIKSDCLADEEWSTDLQRFGKLWKMRPFSKGIYLPRVEPLKNELQQRKQNCRVVKANTTIFSLIDKSLKWFLHQSEKIISSGNAFMSLKFWRKLNNDQKYGWISGHFFPVNCRHRRQNYYAKAIDHDGQGVIGQLTKSEQQHTRDELDCHDFLLFVIEVRQIDWNQMQRKLGKKGETNW